MMKMRFVCLATTMIASMVVFAQGASDEASLRSKLPEIFSKAAAHYKVLDAAATSLMNSDNGKGPLVPHGFIRKTGKLDMRGIDWWTTGHYPGSLWYLYEATGDEFFKDRALVWTEVLEPNKDNTSHHDTGFIMYCSYGNARRILKTDKYDSILIKTADSLSKRFHPELGLLRSWGNLNDKKKFLVIPDNMMNLELLEFASKAKGGEKRFDTLARSHATITMKNHFRSDGGTYHVLDYDQQTKRVKEIWRGQGASCVTAWSRGQSWAIYGYTMMYRETGDKVYLDFAEKVTDFAINHPNMPEDGVPYWDFGTPGEERDSSAASIMASGLLELQKYVSPEKAKRYRAFAVKQLLALASPEYFSEGDEIGHWLLKHGVGNKPGNAEIDTPLNYGDYYFLEALLRFKSLTPTTTTFAKDVLAPYVESGELPGAINVFYKNGIQETTCIGYADVEKKRPITMDDVYMQCSQTKGFCGVTIAMLIEEGKINLDDPVSKYLPEFKTLWVRSSETNGVRTLVKAKTPLTIRMCLNHTGGFSFETVAKQKNIKGGGCTGGAPIRPNAAIAAACPLLFEPGTKVQYSNTGIDIGAAIIEVVTGKRWEDFLKERVLDPLDMKSTTFWPTDKQLETQVEMYDCVKGKPAKYRLQNNLMQRPYNGAHVFAAAGGGLWTTANDQLKFYKMLMNLGVGENGVRILKEETVKELLAKSTRPVKFGGYSLGLVAPVKDTEDSWFGHGGAWGTHCMVNWHRKELKLWVVQLNGGPRPWNKAREKAEKKFFKYAVDNSGVDAYTGRIK